MKMIKFPSIEQYNTTIKNLTHTLRYVGKDENGDAIYDNVKQLPTIRFVGTVKLHGTNAGVVWNLETDEFWAQSRERILSIESDNAGFAYFAHNRKEVFKSMIFNYFNTIGELLPKTGCISLYGEWAGPGIQRGVGISEIETKSFFIFDMKYSENIGTEEETSVWLNHYVTKETPHGSVSLFTHANLNIYDIFDFGEFIVDVDMNAPEYAVEELIRITQEVENCCPVAKYFGVDGVGEGVVYRTNISGSALRFKVKGEKHSSSKVKKLASVDIEKVESIKEFVSYAVTENRLNQGIEQVFIQNNITPSISETGSFVKWVSSDVIKEELAVMQESGLEPKEVMGAVSKRAAAWFKEYLMRG